MVSLAGVRSSGVDPVSEVAGVTSISKTGRTFQLTTRVILNSHPARVTTNTLIQTQNLTMTSSTSTSSTEDLPTLFTKALSTLPKNKPIIFTNFLRFHKRTQYPSTIPDPVSAHLSTIPNPITGADAYWTRYFPVYHQATRDVLGDDAEKLQRVMYKGTPLMPLRFATGGSRSSADGNGERYWHAVVVTRVESWDVVGRISEDERYKTLGTFHREAAVEDDELFVSCAVEGFEMEVLG